jgi:hypothetical protein
MAVEHPVDATYPASPGRSSPFASAHAIASHATASACRMSASRRTKTAGSLRFLRRGLPLTLLFDLSNFGSACSTSGTPSGSFADRCDKCNGASGRLARNCHFDAIATAAPAITAALVLLAIRPHAGEEHLPRQPRCIAHIAARCRFTLTTRDTRNMITTNDGTQIYTRTGAKVGPLSSALGEIR